MLGVATAAAESVRVVGVSCCCRPDAVRWSLSGLPRPQPHSRQALQQVIQYHRFSPSGTIPSSIAYPLLWTPEPPCLLGFVGAFVCNAQSPRLPVSS
jgi:hypothetical protein